MKKKALVIEKTPVVMPVWKEKKILLGVFVGALLCTAIGSSFYFFLQYQRMQKIAKNPSAISQEETKDIAQKIGKLIELPQNEIPTLATVSDKKKLANQPFFARAENGDKVLIYTQAKKAILYRPSTNKIIELTALQISSETPAPTVGKKEGVSPTAMQIQTKTVAIYNGTSIAGLAGQTERQLSETMTNIKVVEKGDTKGTYAKTFVIDIRGTSKQTAQEIAKVVNGELTSFPLGEEKPDADILIILGK